MQILELKGSSKELNKYLPFMLTSYAKTVRVSSPYFSAIPIDAFNKAIKSHFDALVSKSFVRLLVSKSDNEVIIGYVIYRIPNIISLVFIKRLFRGKGILHHLTDDLLEGNKKMVYTTFVKKENTGILKNHEWEFNPYV